MNKQELIAKIAKDTGSSKAGAAAAVDSLIDGITKSLKKGEAITFVGGDDTDVREHSDVRDRAADVVHVEAPIEADGRRESLDERIRGFREPSAPLSS